MLFYLMRYKGGQHTQSWGWKDLVMRPGVAPNIDVKREVKTVVRLIAT